MRQTLFAGLLVVSLLWLMPAPVRADHDLTCHPPDDDGPDGVPLTYLAIELENTYGEVILFIAANGDARAHGALVPEGARTILIAQGGATASCANLDEDEIGGLTELVIPFRTLRGERITATLVPLGGEVEESGTFRAAVRFSPNSGLATTEAVVRLRFWIGAR